MSLLAFIISLAFTGLIVGAFARLALPGRDPMSIPQTILVGVVGTLAAGMLGGALVGRGALAFAFAVLVSTGIVYAIRRSRGGSLTQPGTHRGLRR